MATCISVKLADMNTQCQAQSSLSTGILQYSETTLTQTYMVNFDGPAEPLNGVQGYYNALNETAKLSSLIQGLGETWEIMPTAYKPYPCGFVIHPVLDCVLDWRREHPAAIVEKVVVTGNPLLAVRTDRPNIATGAYWPLSVPR